MAAAATSPIPIPEAGPILVEHLGAIYQHINEQVVANIDVAITKNNKKQADLLKKEKDTLKAKIADTGKDRATSVRCSSRR